jgi:hypothetical protein
MKRRMCRLLIAAMFLATPGVLWAQGDAGDAEKLPPIEFYGRVVDQDGKPLAGATVTTDIRNRHSVDSEEKYEQVVLTTDADGRFAVTDRRGRILHVDGVDLSGYSFNVDAPGIRRVFRFSATGPKPDAKQPAVFRMRKREEPAFIIFGGDGFGYRGRRLEGWINLTERRSTAAPDKAKAQEKPRKEKSDMSAADIAMMKQMAKTHREMLDRFGGVPHTKADLALTAEYDKRQGTYLVTLRALGKDAGIAESKTRLYLAPEKGYKPTWSIKLVEPRFEADREYSVKELHDALRAARVPPAELYIRCREPAIYARVRLHFRLGGPLDIRATWHTNPYGDRSLEHIVDWEWNKRHEGESQIEGVDTSRQEAELRRRINEVARNSWRAGRMPKKPDLPAEIKAIKDMKGMKGMFLKPIPKQDGEGATPTE